MSAMLSVGCQDEESPFSLCHWNAIGSRPPETDTRNVDVPAVSAASSGWSETAKAALVTVTSAVRECSVCPRAVTATRYCTGVVVTVEAVNEYEA
jgi:hypothetical protein